MAQRVIIELTDDINGGHATQTVLFAVGGVEYEIDLSDKNAAALEKAFATYVAHARRVDGRKRSTGRAGGTPVGIDPAAVRAWAAQQGLMLASRGRIPYAIVDQYQNES